MSNPQEASKLKEQAISTISAEAERIGANWQEELEKGGLALEWDYGFGHRAIGTSDWTPELAARRRDSISLDGKVTGWHFAIEDGKLRLRGFYGTPDTAGQLPDRANRIDNEVEAWERAREVGKYWIDKFSLEPVRINWQAGRPYGRTRPEASPTGVQGHVCLHFGQRIPGAEMVNGNFVQILLRVEDGSLASMQTESLNKIEHPRSSRSIAELRAIADRSKYKKWSKDRFQHGYNYIALDPDRPLTVQKHAGFQTGPTGGCLINVETGAIMLEGEVGGPANAESQTKGQSKSGWQPADPTVLAEFPSQSKQSEAQSFAGVEPAGDKASTRQNGGVDRSLLIGLGSVFVVAATIAMAKVLAIKSGS